MAFFRGFPITIIFGILLISSFIINNDRVTAQVCVDENTCRAEPENEREIKLQQTLQELIAWVNENDGYVNPKLEIRSFPLHLDLKDLVDRYEEESADSASESEDYDVSIGRTFSFGVFVKDGETIEEGEELLEIPEELMIFSDIFSAQRFDSICLLAEELAVQRYNHGHGQSTIAPYMELLEHFVFEEVKLPMTWKLEAKNLLAEITTADFFVPFHFYQECFENVINGVDNREPRFKPEDNLPFWVEAVEVAQALSRNETMMIPIYDMITHTNDPKKINIFQQRMRDKGDERMVVYAKRPIPSSEELRYSFGLGKMQEDQWNGVTKFGMGTMRMFHDFGIIESYPQRWYFPAHMLDFAVDEVFDASGERELKVRWNSDAYADHDAIYTLQVLHDRLAEIKEKMNNWWDFDLRPDFVRGINPQEVKRTFEFLCTYLEAVEVGLEAMRSMHAPDESVYLVEEEKVLINNMDSIYFQAYQCNDMIVNVTNGYFEHIESLRSAYQKIEYFLDPVTKDRCLYLDGVYQQCISYWPHYHELVVHKPAKYLKENLKRVLWVGGGDSGPLNEFLKYPSLELAVGLELDQQVTRLAYKHFASRPHYDDPRVQWWYGDASKSLLMLPEDYFGSFDLVIVDLSDTVFSLSVSAELDVIEAISLLLRPGGIFEMNELFMRKVSNVFEHAIHYNFNDVPKILDQAAIFASNDVNFLFQELTEHEFVEDATLLVEKDSMLTRHQFDRVHDYRHNPNSAFVQLCKKMQEAKEEEMQGDDDDKPQTTAPGIMMIVEAEKLTADLSSPSVVQSSIIDAIEGVGLTVVSDKLSALESPWFVIVMKEGYVVVRLWSEEKYCALDLHLWSSFDSHEGLKKAIVVKALGGDLRNKSTTSYRIVAGGMFGTPDWKAESKLHGPQLSKSCVEKKEVLRDQASPMEVQMQALELSLAVLQGTGLTAVVICGRKQDDCAYLEVVKADSKFERVIPLYEATVDKGADRMTRITQSIEESREILEPFLQADPPILVDAIFYDLSSTSISNEVVGMMNNEHRIQQENMYFAATTDSQSEIWRRRVLSSLRDDYDVDPLFRGQVLFNTTNSSLELSIMVDGNPMFMRHLTDAVAESEAKNPDVTPEIRNILGGVIRIEKQADCYDGNITHVTVAEDYNHDDAKSQWSTQTALATQTLLQFSNSVDGTPTLMKKDDLVKACAGAFATRIGVSMKIYDDFGGDGAICAGTWETGTAVVSWDGRYGVDLNIFSTLDLPELQSFEKDIKTRLTNLGGWLRDIQPRGYGRVVSFKEGMLGKASFFTDDEAEKEDEKEG